MPYSYGDLPPRGQRWARDIEERLARIEAKEAALDAALTALGIDPRNPFPGGGAPSVRKPGQQRLSSLADVNTLRVQDGQALVWSEATQQWAAATMASGGGSAEWINPDAKSTFDHSVGWSSDPAEVWDGRTFKVMTFPRAPEDSSPGSYLDSEGVIGFGTNDAYLGVYSVYGPDGTQVYSYSWSNSWESGQTFNSDNGTTYGAAEVKVGKGGVNLTAYTNTGSSKTGGFINFIADWLTLPLTNSTSRPSIGPWTPAWDTSHTLGRGAIRYDTTLHKPIFFDGTIWRDAAGTAV